MSATVLIVDDNVNAQIVAETLLRLRDLDVLIAADGAQACEIAEREDPAVVVVDLNTAGMGGFEVLSRLRGRFGSLLPRIDPRIIVVTDRNAPEAEYFARELGADVFLRKPIAPGVFIKTVVDLAEGTVPKPRDAETSVEPAGYLVQAHGV